MKALEILTDTSVKGVSVSPGDIVEVDDADGRLLMSYGLARPVCEKKTNKKQEGDI